MLGRRSLVLLAAATFVIVGTSQVCRNESRPRFDGHLPADAIEVSSGTVRHTVLPTGHYWIFGTNSDVGQFFDEATVRYRGAGWDVFADGDPYRSFAMVSPDDVLCVSFVELLHDAPPGYRHEIEAMDDRAFAREHEFSSLLFVLRRPCF